MLSTSRKLAGQAANRIQHHCNMVSGALFDRWYGIETNRIVLEPDLRSASPNLQQAYRYHPTSVGGVSYAINLLDIDHANYRFIDIGSGKGRALLEAARFPFEKIVGVEFCPELHRAAEHTVPRYLDRTGRQTDFELYCMDALDFPIPEQNTVFYLYHPFQESVLQRFVGNIEAALRNGDTRADIFVVYAMPYFKKVFETSPCFEFVTAGRHARMGYRVYRNRRGENRSC